jgi:hypothetical protein
MRRKPRSDDPGAMHHVMARWFAYAGSRSIFREDWGKVLFSPNFKLAILRMRTKMLFYKMALLDSCFKAFEIGGVQLCLS